MIEVRELRFAYPGRPAVLDGIDISVRPGERIALAGWNGSGKSTLLRCLSGLLPCGPGMVLIDGCDPCREPDRAVALAATGLLFETPDEQFVAPTVEREVAFVLENRGLPRCDIRARVDRAMALFDLGRLAHRDPGTLSGGEKQRVALAAVLAGNPTYVLLDDPGSRLDGPGRALLEAWLRAADPPPAVVETTLRRGPAAMAGTVWALAGGKLTSAARPPLDRPPWSDVLLGEDGGGPHAPDRGGEPLLEARGLGVAWPGDAGPPLFEGLDAVVAAGEVLAVVGPSGSGKTTLLRVLGGITRPWKGSVRPPAAGRPGARVAFVPQFAEAQLFAPTVAEDVAFAPGRAGLPRAEAAERSAEALRRVGLDPVVHGKAFPLDLSQGERRRAALAGVLSAEPNVLLLDEPETGLDPPGRRLLLDIMASLLARGVGLCVATHQPGWLAPLPGRTLLLCREGGWGTGAEHPRGA